MPIVLVRMFVLLFTMREFYFYPPIMVAIKHVILSGMTGTVYILQMTLPAKKTYPKVFAFAGDRLIKILKF